MSVTGASLIAMPYADHKAPLLTTPTDTNIDRDRAAVGRASSDLTTWGVRCSPSKGNSPWN